MQYLSKFEKCTHLTHACQLISDMSSHKFHWENQNSCVHQVIWGKNRVVRKLYLWYVK